MAATRKDQKEDIEMLEETKPAPMTQETEVDKALEKRYVYGTIVLWKEELTNDDQACAQD